MARKIVLHAVFVLGCVVAACQPLSAQESMPGKKLKVVATLFPVYDFAKQIGKEKIEVTLLLPPGMEAHSFEPTPNDIITIHKADSLIYTGRNMEPWVERILKGVSSKDLLVIDASAGIPSGKDPHIWLDFGYASQMTDTIAQGFARKDPANAQEYLDNARRYKAKLSELDARCTQAFARCKFKTFIYAGHSAFGYFARHLGLTYQSPYQGYSVDAEPGPKAIAELIDKIKVLGVRYIYYEELIDPKIARIISAETGAGLLLLNGAHNVSRDEFARGQTFLGIMEENLRNLVKGLECQ